MKLLNALAYIHICKLFAALFDKGMAPSIWFRAIVNPIPKGSGKDPYIPINYRGISLVSCISKTS
jgi:hypothetical protein